MDPTVPRSALDGHPDALAIVSADGTCRYATGSIEGTLGLDAEELVDRRLLEDVHPADRSRVQETLDSLTATAEGRTETVTFRYRVDDNCRRIEARASNDCDAPDACLLACRDVSDRQATHRRRLEEFAEHGEDVLWMVTGDWRECLYLSSGFEDVYGIAAERFDEDPGAILDAIHPADRDDAEAAMATLSGGEPIELQCRGDPTWGYDRRIGVRAYPVVENGSVARIIGFSRDVTDQQRRERHLQVMDRLLRHNLRNDLNVVMGHAQLARERGDEAVNESMDTVVETVDDLLQTAEKEREILRLLDDVDGPTTMDFVTAVERAIDGAAAAAPAAQIDADLPSSVPVRAVEEIEGAVEELIENAISHARGDAPTVSVRVRDRGDRVQLTVRDQGPPIPEHEFQVLAADEAGDLNHGTGLGLWMVYWIVDLSEGTIDFSASESRGNVVTVRLRRGD